MLQKHLPDFMEHKPGKTVYIYGNLIIIPMDKFFLLLILATISMSATAQEPAPDQQVSRKNSVKFLPVNMVLNSVAFEYERMISPKNSLTLGIGIPTNGSFTDKFFVDNSDPANMPYNDKLGVLSIRAAYRHYTGKSGLPRGFYISPYLKYQDIQINATFNTTDDNNNSYKNKVDMKGNTMNLGLQLGYQFLIGKRVNIDFYFFGLEGGLANMDASATPYDPAFLGTVESDVQDFVDGLPTYIGDKMEVTKNSTSVLLKGNSIPYPFYRGGISLGIAF